MTDDDEGRISFLGYATIVATRFRLVLAMIVVALAVATIASASVTPMFTATSSLALAVPVDIEKRDPVGLQVTTANLLKSCIAVASEEASLRPAARSIGLDPDAEPVPPQVDAQALRDTGVIDVSVTDVSAQRAAQLADAVTAQMVPLCDSIQPVLGPGQRVYSFSVAAHATVPTDDDPPRWGLSLLLALMVGTVAGIAVAVAADDVRPQLRSWLRRAPGSAPPLLGRLSRWRRGARRARNRAQLGRRLEAICRDTGARSVLLTSTSTSCAERAADQLTAALAGPATQTADADTAEDGRGPLEAAVAPPADLVVLTAPASLRGPERAELFESVDAVVVVERGRTAAATVEDEVATLTTSGARVLGVVLVS